MSTFYSGSGSSGGGGSVNIPEVYSDPVSPVPQSAWVLATSQGTIGSPLGLLLSLTHSANIFFYQFSYQTLEGTTIRTPLS